MYICIYVYIGISVYRLYTDLPWSSWATPNDRKHVISYERQKTCDPGVPGLLQSDIGQ